MLSLIAYTWRRSQVAKASDCKSDIVGSTPTDASYFLAPRNRWGVPGCFSQPGGCRVNGGSCSLRYFPVIMGDLAGLSPRQQPTSLAAMSKVPNVALLLETARGYVRRVVKYSSIRGPWSFLLTPADFMQEFPSPESWSGDGVIARLSYHASVRKFAVDSEGRSITLQQVRPS